MVTLIYLTGDIQQDCITANNFSGTKTSVTQQESQPFRSIRQMVINQKCTLVLTLFHGSWNGALKTCKCQYWCRKKVV